VLAREDLGLIVEPADQVAPVVRQQHVDVDPRPGQLVGDEVAQRVDPQAGAGRDDQAVLLVAAQPVVQEAQSVAKEAAENLKEPARESLQSVKETAQDAVETVKSEGQSAAEDVKGSAQDAKDTVQEQAGDGSAGSSGQVAYTGYTSGSTPGTLGS
jgi:hypothetical protein